jgi:hypothetical protein
MRTTAVCRAPDEDKGKGMSDVQASVFVDERCRGVA